MTEPERAAGKTLQLKRLLPARRERVFRAWTDPEEIAQWFCPSAQHQVKVIEQDVREGGRYRLEIKSPDGTLHVVAGTYRLVHPPEKLVYTWRWQQGGVGDTETLVTIDLHEKNEQTELVLTHERFPDEEVQQKHQEGWNSCLDRLQEHTRQPA
jgi:uncharacterized protein YndB with AHSA1/START domain